MKFVEKSRADGFLKLKVENSDDLWYLDQVLSKGDEVEKRTMRTMLDGREKKSVVLKLRVEKTELQDERLRVTGEITEGAENIELGYHTFNIEKNDELSVWKDFTGEEWETLEKAENHRSYRVLFCIVEKGKADFYQVRESGIDSLSGLESNIPGKLYSDQDRPDFADEVASNIRRSSEKFDYIVLAGPGHFKQEIANNLEIDDLYVVDTSVTGETGLHEAIKRGALRQVVEDSRISEETQVMEDFFERLEKDHKVSYGEPVEDIVEQGAVEKLLITPQKFREDQSLVERAEQMGAEVLKIHTDHEPGKRLEKMGGIAAFLRYDPQGRS